MSSSDVHSGSVRPLALRILLAILRFIGRGLIRTPRWLGRALIGPPTRASRTRRALAVTLAAVVGVAVWSMGVIYSEYSAGEGSPDGTNLTPAQRNEKRALGNRLRRMTPSRRFVVIDHTHNRLYLREGNRVVLDALCSTGSGFVLTDGKHRWVFDTPIGKFSVQTKLTNPVWRKPDWAFVEEGVEIPTDPSERFERGALGEYGLYLGNGYLIHGTLYERLLGRSVTHGCIRVGRDDLRLLYRSVDVGTPVYIY